MLQIELEKVLLTVGENNWKCTIHYRRKWSQQLLFHGQFPFRAPWQDRGASGNTFVNSLPL